MDDITRTEICHTFKIDSLLEKVLMSSPDITYIVDKNGKFLFGNSRAKNLFLTGVDVLDNGKYLKLELDMFNSEIIYENAKLLLSGENFSKEVTLQATNGEKYWYKISKTPIKGVNNKYCAVAVFARNIDAEKRVQEQRDTYIATLSHDLKTPTIAQVRALELLLSGQMGEFNEKQKELLKLTLDSCKYMYDMLHTLLSACKLESGEVALRYSDFNLVNLVKESIYETSKITCDNSIKMNFKPSSDICMVWADKIELKRVIVNFLANAVVYAFPNSVIDIELVKICDYIEFRVTNSSAYITPDLMSKLFRQYVTHSEKYHKVGAGLGLYLAKKIVEAHNGKVIANSLKENKNIFGFVIPVGIGDKVKRSNFSFGSPLLITC